MRAAQFALGRDALILHDFELLYRALVLVGLGVVGVLEQALVYLIEHLLVIVCG